MHTLFRLAIVYGIDRRFRSLKQQKEIGEEREGERDGHTYIFFREEDQPNA